MDAVPNPNNNPNLAAMNIMVRHSEDGFNRNGTTAAWTPDNVDRWNVRNGECIIVERIPFDLGGKVFQFIFFQPVSTHLLFTGSYGARHEMTGNLGTYHPMTACPSLEVIGQTDGEVQCTLRSGHFLDYKW